MQKKRRRSFRKKIKLPLHKTPAQRFRMELRRREKTRAKSREKIARIKMQYKTKAVKQKGRQKEKAAGRIDRMLSAVAFLLGAGIMVLDGLLESRKRYPEINITVIISEENRIIIEKGALPRVGHTHGCFHIMWPW